MVLRQAEGSPPFVLSHFSVCHLVDAAVGLPIHPGALYFNQYHIKFNTCFEIRTRSKVLPGGGVRCLLQKHIPFQLLLHKQLSFTFGWTKRTVNTSTLPNRREVMGSNRKEGWMLWGSDRLTVCESYWLHGRIRPRRKHRHKSSKSALNLEGFPAVSTGRAKPPWCNQPARWERSSDQTTHTSPHTQGGECYQD